jgi:hypothetical protein
MIREPRVDTWGSLLLHLSKEEPMTMLQDAKRLLKADREREKTEAMREYQAEKVAAQANMARLRALRLANECVKESTASPPQAAPRPTKRKAANR